DVRDTADHAAFFKSVAGFDVNRKQGSFVILRSARGEILLNGVGAAKDAKPIRYQGPRVEIGIVVDDLDKAYAEAKQRKGWTLQGGIARQLWNARDFLSIHPKATTFGLPKGRSDTRRAGLSPIAMADLRDKTLVITGASRGIGKAIALRPWVHTLT